MSKRDELMKLKAKRVHKPIHEMETPVEDIPLVLDEEKNSTDNIEKNSSSSKIIDETMAQKETIIQEKEQIEEHKLPEIVEKEVKKTTDLEKTKRTSMSLKLENNRFIRLRSMQLGMTIQYYINLLIQEEKERILNQNFDMSVVAENIELNYKRGDNTTIVALVLKESNAKFLKRSGAMLGMNPTTFLNYIISEEEKREEVQGKRKSEYDE